MIRHRYVTGPDDSSFCDRVTEALNDGWALYGSPPLAFIGDTGTMVCGQTVVRYSHPDDPGSAS